MGKIIKIFTVLISLVLIATAVAVALLAFPVFGNQALIVRSGSMEPNIPVGSIVVIRPSETNTYQVGEVISFRRDANTIVTHRITGVQNTTRGITYTTKGDANEEADAWTIKHQDVLGKDFIILPEFGKLLAFAKSKYGFPLLIIFPAVFVILVEVINLVREIIKVKKKGKEAGGHKNFSNGEIEKISISPDSYFTKRNFYSLKIILPIISFGFFLQYTSAFFSDTATSPNNLFQAASSFSTNPTPTPTGEPNNIPAECSHINFTGETIFGTELDDKINGTPDSELILVFGGNDEIKGGAGNDCIVATGGVNMLDGDSGNDVIISGDGDDEIYGGSGNDFIFAGDGNDIINGGSGDDKLFGEDGDDNIDGGTGNDTCEGETLRRCEL